ncbi:MAG: CBS domain-containing protein, partial [Lentisphaerae bacterium]|nr:CBS domain-containing protein [Lentisphaerota bacterium]
MSAAKSVKEVMSGHVVTVPPSAIAKSAVFLMRGHEIGALPVVHDHGALMGIVYLQDLLGRDPMISVSDLMTKEITSVSPNATVFEAAELMTKTRHSHLVVVDEGELVGIVSHSDALSELGTSFDPLTGLPWSDALRDWAISALKGGHEIAVLFFDLNLFGQFNKKYGHITGDAVLKSVSETLKANVDPHLDFLCRYGGDEFALATVRHADEAIELAESLVERISQIELSEVPEGIGATYGIAGGRRTKERLDVHYAAT